MNFGLSRYAVPGLTWIQDRKLRGNYVSLQRLRTLVQEGRDFVSDEEALQDYNLRRSFGRTGALRERQ